METKHDGRGEIPFRPVQDEPAPVTEQPGAQMASAIPVAEATPATETKPAEDAHDE